MPLVIQELESTPSMLLPVGHPLQESGLGETEQKWWEGGGSALTARSAKPTLALSGLADGTARLSHQPGATN